MQEVANPQSSSEISNKKNYEAPKMVQSDLTNQSTATQTRSNLTVTILGGLLICLLAVVAFQYYQISQLTFLVTISQKTEKINDDNFRDILSSFMDKTRIDGEKNQGRLEGMLTAINRDKLEDFEISQVWHDGYERGLNQSRDVEALATKTFVPASGEVSPKK